MLIIGDLHGSSCWENVNAEKYHQVIFLGDYVDGFDKTDTEIYENLKKLISFKEKHPDRVILLLGNHDIQYLHFPAYRCSGFRPSLQMQLTDLFHQYQNCFQVAWQVQNYLFTHAGVSATWYQQFIALPIIADLIKEPGSLADLLNKAEASSKRDFLHRAGYLRGGEGYGGITWADKAELENDLLPGYHQFVGHTPVPWPIERKNDANTSVFFLDVLHTTVYFHELEIPDISLSA